MTGTRTATTHGNMGWEQWPYSLGHSMGVGGAPTTWLWRDSWIPDWSEQVNLELAAL